MFFSKNRELASLKQHGFLNEKTIDFLNAFSLGGIRELRSLNEQALSTAVK
jgi:hypothetical protein